MFGRRRRDAWIFLNGRTPGSADGAAVTLAERKLTLAAGGKDRAEGRSAWAIFPETPLGTYTVHVSYPSGARQTARLTVTRTHHLITLDEPPA